VPAPADRPDRQHFSVVVDYADPDSALTRATLALFADQGPIEMRTQSRKFHRMP
jgi:hypothetical protein